MKEKIFQMIRESAEEIEIPEGLRPEKIQEKLEAVGSVDEGEFGETAERTGAAADAGGRTKIRRYLPAVYGVSAAALLLLCCFGLYQSGLFPKQRENAAGAGAQQEAMMAPQEMEEGALAEEDGEAADGAGALAEAVEEEGGAAGGAAGREGALMDGAPEEEVAAGAGNTGEEAERQANRQEKLQEKKRDAGDLYKVASGYEEVYGLLLASGYGGMIFSDGMEAAVMEAAPADGAYSVKGSEPSNNIDSIVKASSADLGYSTTNLQMEGVDESDIVKTDGSYILHRERQSGLYHGRQDGQNASCGNRDHSPKRRKQRY